MTDNIELELFLFKHNLTDTMFQALKLSRNNRRSDGKYKLIDGTLSSIPEKELEDIINLTECHKDGKFIERLIEGNQVRLVVKYRSGKKINGRELYDFEDPAIDEKISELYKILNNGK